MTATIGSDTTSAFPLLPFEQHECCGTGHLGDKPRATWAVYFTIGATVATAHVCDVCKAMI